MRKTKINANKKFIFSQKVSAKKRNWEKKTSFRPKKFVFDADKKITSNHRRILNFELDRLNRLDCQTLRKILERNCQNWFGNKLELMLRVSQGRIFGTTPACPICKQRKLDLDFETETYKCNSTIFLPDKLDYCEASFLFSSIKTTKWLEDEDFTKDWEE